MNTKGIKKRLQKIENTFKPTRKIHVVICRSGQNPKEVWSNYIRDNQIEINDFIITMNMTGRDPFF